MTFGLPLSACRAAAAPPLHALANEQYHRVVRVPELEATGSKDVCVPPAALGNEQYHCLVYAGLLHAFKISYFYSS